jgi:hypothetical protein
VHRELARGRSTARRSPGDLLEAIDTILEERIVERTNTLQ